MKTCIAQISIYASFIFFFINCLIPLKIKSGLLFLILTIGIFILSVYIGDKVEWLLDRLFKNDVQSVSLVETKDIPPKKSLSASNENITSNLNLYTLNGLLSDFKDKKVDESRIPPSLQGYYVSLKSCAPNKHYTKKHNIIKKSTQKYTDVSPEEIRSMNWREFEIFISNLLTNNGYKTILTPAQQDGGKDIIAEKDGVKYYIECKHWKESGSIGRELLQKLVGAAVGNNVTNVIFIATCGFHENAKSFAKETNLSGIVKIELWNMRDILTVANKGIATLRREKEIFNLFK